MNLVKRLRMPSWSKTKTVLDGVGLVIFILLGTLLLYRMVRPLVQPQRPAARRAARPPAPLPTAPLSLQGAAIKGDVTARVAVVAYSDFQCPFCARFALDTLPALEDRYLKTGKALFAFRHYPLVSIHPQAVKASEAAECARQQSRFWEMHDRIFLSPKQLDDLTLTQHAKVIGLSPASFAACLSGQATATVQADADAATTLMVDGTPTFFIGNVLSDGTVKVTKRLDGAQPVSAFVEVLDALTARVGSR